MNVPMKKVVLMPNTAKQIDAEHIRRLSALFSAAGCSVAAPEDSRKMLESAVSWISYGIDEEVFAGADAIFVLGGDGSIIEAARRSVGFDVPIAGINFGRLGYLAEIEIGETEPVAQILRGEAWVEERMMLDIAVIRGGETLRIETPALNDIVLTNGPVPRLLSFSLYYGGEPLESCYADGMILATPTGSTAYSLSAGGPVLDPCMDCICATPICPQTVNNRPVIFTGDAQLELRSIRCRGDNTVYLSIDGRESLTLREDDIVSVHRSESRTKLLRIKKGGFLHALRRKLS